MKKIIAVALFAGLVFTASTVSSYAQIAPASKSGVAMGHIHLIVADVPGAQKFFTTLGGTPLTVRDNPAVKFPGVLILLRQGTPAGPSDGSVVQHFGFNVVNSKDALARWTAAGLNTETASEDKKTLTEAFVKAQLAAGRNPGQFFVWTPDKLTRIEFLQEEKQAQPIVFHHVHFYPEKKDIPGLQEWYAKTFDGVPGMRGQNVAVDLPGVNLSILPAPMGPVAPTKGRIIDHIGFEIADLQAFCKKLEASGVKFEEGYIKRPDGVATAFLVDPYGTRIELTEGLRRF